MTVKIYVKYLNLVYVYWILNIEKYNSQLI